MASSRGRDEGELDVVASLVSASDSTPSLVPVRSLSSTSRSVLVATPRGAFVEDIVSSHCIQV